MKSVFFKKAFRRDLKRARKRNLDIEKLRQVVQALSDGKRLPPSYHTHRLKGRYSDCWECHISPDWLLIWREAEDAIYLERSGSHSDLFG